RRARPAAAERDRRAGRLGLERAEDAVDPVALCGGGHADVEPRVSLGGDDVLARSARDDADVEEYTAARIGERVQPERQPRQLLDRARPLARLGRVRGPAGDDEVEATEAAPSRLQIPVLRRRLAHEGGGCATGCTLDRVAPGRAADLLVGGEEDAQRAVRRRATDRLEHDDETPFHVVDTRAERAAVLEPPRQLGERPARPYGVEVPE